MEQRQQQYGSDADGLSRDLYGDGYGWISGAHGCFYSAGDGEVGLSCGGPVGGDKSRESEYWATALGYGSGVMPMVASQVSTNWGHPVTGYFVRLRPKA